MYRPRVIPVLLLKEQGVVKTVRFKKPTYIGDPINAVRIFNDKEVDELILLDITASLEQRSPVFQFLQEIVGEAFMPICYGGGIHSVDQARQLFSLGIEKVALNTAAAENPSLVNDIAQVAGNQSVVASIDCRRNWRGQYQVVVRSGTEALNRNPFEFAKEMEQAGAGEIIVNSIDRDGTMKGYDLELIRGVSSAVGVPVIACGGAGELNDFAKAVEAGASAAAAGSVFVFQGKHRAVLLSYPAQQLDHAMRIVASVPG